MRKMLFCIGFFLFFTVNANAYTNYALDFGTVSDYKFFELGPNALFDTNEITFQAWIYPTGLPTGHYIYEGRSTIVWNGDYASGHDPYIFYLNEYGALEAYSDFDNGGSQFIIDTTPVTLNQWHLVTLTIDSIKMGLYLDGNLVEEVIHNNGPIVKNHSWLSIGRHLYFQNSFGGYMDDISIWDRVLTTSEIHQGVYEGLSGNESGLLAYWNFNEGVGQVVNDLTVYANNGQLGSTLGEDLNDPTWVLSDRQYEQTNNAVPEPATLFLLGGGLLGLFLRRGRLEKIANALIRLE